MEYNQFDCSFSERDLYAPLECSEIGGASQDLSYIQQFDDLALPVRDTSNCGGPVRLDGRYVRDSLDSGMTRRATH